MRIQWLTVLLLCVHGGSALPADCPWKLREIEPRLQQSMARVLDAERVADGKDTEIAGLRHATLLGCDPDVEARLEGFDPRIRGLNIGTELDQAETMARCIEIKRAMAGERIIEARGSANRMLEQRLLKVSAEIERLAPDVLDYQVRALQLDSKIQRLGAERERLLQVCAMGDF